MTTARRWVAMDFGGPEVLREVESELPAPGPGQVTIEVRAAGLNPADYKHIAPGQDRRLLPLPIGFEVAGVVSAIGPGTQLASGGGAIGDEVLASAISGGYASAVTVPASDVFAKPASLDFAEAANLLVAGTTAAETLHVTNVADGDIILLHGAAGAVGLSALQQARLLGAQVIGTASEANFDLVTSYGATPVSYGDGLQDRVRQAAPDGVSVVLDTVGSDEAVGVSLALVQDRQRIVTITAFGRARAEGFQAIGAANPESGPFRAAARPGIIRLAAEGKLAVPIARRYPFGQAREALAALHGPHPAGKLALVTGA
jgi:NADPH2:quinone reductase